MGTEGEGEGEGEEGEQRGVAVPVSLREGDKTVTVASDIPSRSILGGQGRKKESPATASYPPMMKALREFMLAMLVHVSGSVTSSAAM